MAVVTVSGCTGSPGATTTALALLLSWPLEPGRRAILAECDPDGGSVVLGALSGRTPGSYGLRNLAVADRQGQLGEAFWRQLVDLSDRGTDRLLLPGITDPAQAAGLAYTWERLADLFTSIENVLPSHDVIVDLGRSGAFGLASPLVRKADVQLVVVRGTLRGVQSAQVRVRALREDLEAHSPGSDGLGAVLVEAGPYGADEVSRELGVPVVMTLPHSPKAAAVLSDGEEGGRGFKRSDLMRAARTGAERVSGLVTQRRARLAPVPRSDARGGQPNAQR
ncbi:hypothetical protein PUR71_07230 [Streptomyces sp. SP17BM10]|uniref:hypothetical protein n=1 Tax=Streptomyces sp. SP17BM10 TaxID=3002530 RepID=UPI002E78DC25|nr:hypothetical protein [Streptomyces sp. SP17BM10]MEE1782714.1 hypothetical protein [Streptomyces sp. SP17BM10]